jgi:hypothetical protein
VTAIRPALAATRGVSIVYAVRCTSLASGGAVEQLIAPRSSASVGTVKALEHAGVHVGHAAGVVAGGDLEGHVVAAHCDGLDQHFKEPTVDASRVVCQGPLTVDLARDIDRGG